MRSAASSRGAQGHAGAGSFILAALSLVICVAVAKELVYQGVLQTAASAALGRVGMLYTSLAFTAGYLGNGSVLSVALAFVAGLLFAFLRVKTGSPIGVILAHSVALVLLVLALPHRMAAVR
jgi:membrane protease YdiL (CAAX protease family)